MKGSSVSAESFRFLRLSCPSCCCPESSLTLELQKWLRHQKLHPSHGQVPPLWHWGSHVSWRNHGLHRQVRKKMEKKKKILWKKVTEKFQSFLYPHPVFFQSNKYWQWTSKPTQRLIYWPNPSHISLSRPTCNRDTTHQALQQSWLFLALIGWLNLSQRRASLHIYKVELKRIPFSFCQGQKCESRTQLRENQAQRGKEWME